VVGINDKRQNVFAQLDSRSGAEERIRDSFFSRRRALSIWLLSQTPSFCKAQFPANREFNREFLAHIELSHCAAARPSKIFVFIPRSTCAAELKCYGHFGLAQRGLQARADDRSAGGPSRRTW
jgi:hypothetical protein